MFRTNAYTDENGYEGAVAMTDAERYAAAARRPILLGAGPAPTAAEVPAGAPRRAFGASDEDLLAAFLASPDYAVLGR